MKKSIKTGAALACGLMLAVVGSGVSAEAVDNQLLNSRLQFGNEFYQQLGLDAEKAVTGSLSANQWRMIVPGWWVMAEEALTHTVSPEGLIVKLDESASRKSNKKVKVTLRQDITTVLHNPQSSEQTVDESSFLVELVTADDNQRLTAKARVVLVGDQDKQHVVSGFAKAEKVKLESQKSNSSRYWFTLDKKGKQQLLDRKQDCCKRKSQGGNQIQADQIRTFLEIKLAGSDTQSITVQALRAGSIDKKLDDCRQQKTLFSSEADKPLDNKLVCYRLFGSSIVKEWSSSEPTKEVVFKAHKQNQQNESLKLGDVFAWQVNHNENNTILTPLPIKLHSDADQGIYGFTYTKDEKQLLLVSVKDLYQYRKDEGYSAASIEENFCDQTKLKGLRLQQPTLSVLPPRARSSSFGKMRKYVQGQRNQAN